MFEKLAIYRTDIDVYMHIGNDIQNTLLQFTNNKDAIPVDCWCEYDDISISYANLHRYNKRAILVAFRNAPSLSDIDYELAYLIDELDIDTINSIKEAIINLLKLK